jgi:type I restriction enzyme S subunit
MKEWPLRTIGDLVMLQRGIDLPDHSRGVGDIPIMGSFGITGRHNVAACKGPGVTVGRSGASAGTVCYIGEDYWPLNTCLYVRDFKGNDQRFVYHFLKTIDLAGMNSGSAQPSLNRNFVHPMPVRFPEPQSSASSPPPSPPSTTRSNSTGG